jgi:light-regulated signal transduction histidine kinase (bacteriophytochrome)
MFHLIKDLLDLSKVSRSQMNLSRIDLSALVRDVAKELKQQFPQRDVEMIILPGQKTLADPGFLRIAIENLMGNAWKFTSKKRFAKVEFGVVTEENKPVYFLRDNGAGFDMSYIQKLFVAFQRLHGAHDYPGTGIGLATVHRIILQHGGKIWAESKVGEGSTFYFTLSP